MGCLYKFNGFQRLVLSSVLCAFPLAVITPPHIYGQIDFNDVNFGVRIQKLIDKAWKYYEKSDSESLLDVILDIKTEVESYTKTEIDIEKEVDKIESELKKKGGKPPKGIFKQFKKFIKKKDKKKHARAMHMETYFYEEPNIGFNEYEALHLAAIAKKHDEDKDEKEIPLKFVLGVSLILGGAFVMFATPVCPLLGYTGEALITTGFGMLLDQGIDIYQKDY
ncbi:hypothetical protein [Candidatus Protochlamydia phocaeensis]|uniref:hypothetical protein n=1 Tax=Candidatus Protochlamydia phocaeensis TaxID=1414722 RepID=UPI0008397458|nr:hypothetical protein [Candidatus Protochlamydia phocaeensis]